MISQTIWKIALRRALGIALAAYGVIIAGVWAKQERLLFKPDPFSRLGQAYRAARSGRLVGRSVREWSFLADDGIRVQGFISLPVGAQGKGPLPAVVYFGGIREESSWSLAAGKHFEGCAFVCLNYRGYGLSGGAPAQRLILKDCEGALAMLASQGLIDTSRMIFIGRSLGSGVAGYLSALFKPKAVCLITPYDSVLAVAKRMYWWMPVRYMFRHPFEALPWAQRNDMPMLMLLSEKDATVPHAHSQRLFSAWSGVKQQETLRDCDHSSVIRHPRLFPLIQERLMPFLSASPAAEDAARGTQGVDEGWAPATK